jgi:hypothetical protein
VTLEPDAGEFLRALHRTVQKCLDENSIGSVVFHLGQQAFDLRASA